MSDDYKGKNVPDDFNILMAAADERKAKAYKDLDKQMKDVLRPSNKTKEDTYSMNSGDAYENNNFVTYFVAFVMASLFVGALFNFGRQRKNWKGIKPKASWIQNERKRL